MHLSRIAIIGVTAVLALATTGCRCPSGCCLPASPHLPCDSETAAVDRTPPDLMRLTPDCEAEQCTLAELPSTSEFYHLLTPADCQCRAATNCGMANLVGLEEQWAGVVIECDSDYVARNLCLQRDLLELHSADLRNRAAADALVAYYRLAGVEARQHYIDAAIGVTQQSIERGEDLQTSGLPLNVDLDAARGRLSELLDARVQLELARVQLNGQLQKLMGCPVGEGSFYWPQMDWTPDLTPLDADAELAMALDQRFDIRGLGLILCKLEKSTLRVARGVLAVADATLGSVEPTEGWVHRLRCIACSDYEVPLRCRQLSMLYADAEQLATAEIKGAVYQVTAAQHRVVLARQAVAERRGRLYELEATRQAENVTIFELSTAEARVYEAESTLIDRVTDLNLARVQLKRAQAMLARECGFEVELCCEGCCDGACMQCQLPTCRPGDLPCRCGKCGTCTKD